MLRKNTKIIPSRFQETRNRLGWNSRWNSRYTLYICFKSFARKETYSRIPTHCAISNYPQKRNEFTAVKVDFTLQKMRSSGSLYDRFLHRYKSLVGLYTLFAADSDYKGLTERNGTDHLASPFSQSNIEVPKTTVRLEGEVRQVHFYETFLIIFSCSRHPLRSCPYFAEYIKPPEVI